MMARWFTHATRRAAALPPSTHSHEDAGMERNLSDSVCARLLPCCTVALLALCPPAFAQETGTVKGTVTRALEGSALSSVSVTVQSTGQNTVTGNDGGYTLRRVPTGAQNIVFRWLGYRPTQVAVIVEPNATITADAALEPVTISLGEIVVQG